MTKGELFIPTPRISCCIKYLNTRKKEEVSACSFLQCSVCGRTYFIKGTMNDAKKIG